MPGRLEFNMDTPIPVIKGTNYAKAFADSEAVRKRIEAAKSAGPSDTVGPYSSLFDWKKEEGDLAASQEKRQKTQQKIMRTNALGDAFRVLIETVGAFGGGTITQRQANPSLLNAYNEYAKNDIDYINRLEGIKTKKLALGQADLQYNLGQNALALEKAEKREAESRAESRQAEKELDQYIRELQLQANQYRLQGRNDEAKALEQRVNLGLQTQLEIELARKKANFDRGWGLQGEGETQPQFDLKTPSKSSDKNQKVPFIVPDKPTMTIQLPPELIDEIRFQLIGPDGNKYDPQVPDALRAVLKNKKPEISSLTQEIRANWSMIKERMKSFAPNAYEQIYGATEQDTTQTATPGTAPASTTQQTTIPAGQEELQQKIHNNLTSDPKLDLENNNSVKKKIGEIADMIYANYLLQPGNKKNRNDAITEANIIVSRFRKLTRGKVE